MPLEYSNRELTEIVNLIRPVGMTITDRYFTRRRNLTTPIVGVDIVDRPEGIMVTIGDDSESRRMPARSRERRWVGTPRVSEHDLIDLSEQISYAAPGTLNGRRSFQELVAEKLGDLRARIDRFTEFASSRAIFNGTITDGNGETIHTVPLPAVVTGIDMTLEAGLDIFDDAQRDISRILGVENPAVDCWMGDTAYRKFKKNPRITELLSDRSKDDLLINGMVRRYDGVTVTPLRGTYRDNDDNEQPWLGDNAIVFITPLAMFRLYNGAIAGKGGRMVSTPIYVEQTEVSDPNATKIRAEARPLPIPERPNLIRRYTVA